MLGGGELTIESARLSKDGNETEDPMIARWIAISLSQGTILVSYRRPAGAAGRLLVSTPQGTIVSNSDCLINIAVSSQRLHVGCISGSVKIASTSGQKALSVDAGFVAESTPQTSTLMEAAGDAAAQQEITEAISAERELLALVRRQRDILH
jgi:hypothetical protein